KKAGRAYRLPTEAEWEYACRGGASSYQVFHYGNSLSSSHANFDGRYPYGSAEKEPDLGRTCKVGSYKPNAFGLYDLHGNVWEWCSDWYDKDYDGQRRNPLGPAKGTFRVVRGGSWLNYSGICRTAHRYWNTSKGAFNCVGFRAAAVLVPEAGSQAAPTDVPS